MGVGWVLSRGCAVSILRHPVEVIHRAGRCYLKHLKVGEPCMGRTHVSSRGANKKKYFCPVSLISPS